MPLNRAQIGNLYRPVGAKPVSLGNAWASGGTLNLVQQLDLSLPIRGLRIVFKGRLAVGTANFTSVNPEGFLNLLPNIQIIGTNRRQGGNVTLYNMDAATQFSLLHLFAPNRRAGYDIGGTLQTKPTMPFPSYFAGTTAGSPYDWRIELDFPFYPFEAPAGVRPGFLMRQEEWLSSVQILISYGTQAGNATGALGVAAATTTVTFTANGSASGSPTVDIYSLPVVMGLDIKDAVLPGFISRVAQPINTILQTTATGVVIQLLQKQPTLRVYKKIGVSSAAAGFTYFSSLSDVCLTASGLTVGGVRAVRPKVDIFATKQSLTEHYGADQIQGYSAFDFLESQNPDSNYPGAFLGDGTAFQLVGDVTALTNGYGLIVQEMMLWRPEGPLYTF